MTTNRAIIWAGTQNGYVPFGSLSPLEQQILNIFGAEPEFEPIPLTPLQRVLMGVGYRPVRRTGSLVDVEMVSPAGFQVVVDGLGSIRQEASHV